MQQTERGKEKSATLPRAGVERIFLYYIFSRHGSRRAGTPKTYEDHKQYFFIFWRPAVLMSLTAILHLHTLLRNKHCGKYRNYRPENVTQGTKTRQNRTQQTRISYYTIITRQNVKPSSVCEPCFRQSTQPHLRWRLYTPEFPSQFTPSSCHFLLPRVLYAPFMFSS